MRKAKVLFLFFSCPWSQKDSRTKPSELKSSEFWFTPVIPAL
jgi:hypothetical protein